jgi:hypothetical protein
MIRDVGVQALLDRPGGESKCPPPRRHLDRLEIDLVADARIYERFDLRDDFRLEVRFEPPFLAASAEAASAESSSASAQRSQACQ